MDKTRETLRRSWPYIAILVIILIYAASPLCAGAGGCFSTYPNEQGNGAT